MKHELANPPRHLQSRNKRRFSVPTYWYLFLRTLPVENLENCYRYSTIRRAVLLYLQKHAILKSHLDKASKDTVSLSIDNPFANYFIGNFRLSEVDQYILNHIHEEYELEENEPKRKVAKTSNNRENQPDNSSLEPEVSPTSPTTMTQTENIARADATTQFRILTTTTGSQTIRNYHQVQKLEDKVAELTDEVSELRKANAKLSNDFKTLSDLKSTADFELTALSSLQFIVRKTDEIAKQLKVITELPTVKQYDPQSPVAKYRPTPITNTSNQE